VGTFSEDRDDVSFPDTMMRLKLADGVLPQYAAAALASRYGRAHMRGTAGGSATSMMKINRASLGTFLFPVASQETQRALVDKLTQIGQVADAVKDEVASLRHLQSAALAHVFGAVA
jgi:type I restriction enzyme S subunit